VNKATELYNKVKPVFDNYSPKAEHVNQMPERGVKDVLDRTNWGYYQWLASLMKAVKPKQVVELGGAMGVACVMMLSELPETSKLYSITLPEGGLEFSFIKKDYPNFVPVLGDDLNLANWPDDLDLSKTDVWFFDSLHTAEQLEAELALYEQFFKEGAILLFDDIKMEELYPIWRKLPYHKKDVSHLHFSGFGIAVT
jgi:cephalosporin hydroxylase